MHKLGTIREFKTQNFHVIVDAVEEDELRPIMGRNGSTRRGLEDGSLIAFTARARVFFRGLEVASDYLGGCVYKSLDDFEDHRECGRQNRATSEARRTFPDIPQGTSVYSLVPQRIGQTPQAWIPYPPPCRSMGSGECERGIRHLRDGQGGSYFHDMIRTVCAEARQRIRGIQETVRVREVRH